MDRGLTTRHREAIEEITVQSTARTRTRSIAPTYPLSAADRAAHESASHLSPKGLAALHRLETAVAPILRDRQTSDAARREIAEVA